jgi:hypothetical protein
VVVGRLGFDEAAHVLTTSQIPVRLARTRSETAAWHRFVPTVGGHAIAVFQTVSGSLNRRAARAALPTGGAHTSRAAFTAARAVLPTGGAAARGAASAPGTSRASGLRRTRAAARGGRPPTAGVRACVRGRPRTPGIGRAPLSRQDQDEPKPVSGQHHHERDYPPSAIGATRAELEFARGSPLLLASGRE